MTVTLEYAKIKYPTAETFKFGDSEELCHALLFLVREGKKTATCARETDFGGENEAFPVVGRRDIALNWDGTPALVIETKRIERVRFCDMPEAWALLEGEDDSLQGWKDGHQRYHERNNGFNPQMWLIWEQFELIEDFADDQTR